MELYFKIEYKTKWGESVAVSLSNGCDAPIIIRLTTEDGIIWSGHYQCDQPDDLITYRYCIYNYGNLSRSEVAVMPHILFPEKGKKTYELHDWWQDIKRVAGVAIPVFSLRSKTGFGVGDFGDLISLIEWAETTGMKIIQILPINDTTISHEWTDSYPYNSISIYALHPQYIDIRQLGKLKDAKLMKKFEKERLRLNSLEKIDYPAVNNAKREYTRLVFEQDGETTLKSADFKSFFKKNKEWLCPYAAFSYLRDKYGNADFNKWEKYNTYNEKEIKSLIKDNKDIEYYYFVQYHLHKQLLKAGNLARKKNIILKGDIPIGISTNSVEAWKEPSYFNMDMQTGAPPDSFCEDGQNWGFPTYNWDVMERNGYDWWMRRMQKMSEYFSAYRIDHILGFFRIWQIPQPHKSGLMGTFSPALPLSVEEIESYGLKFHSDLFLPDNKHHDLYHPKISAQKEPTYKELPLQEKHAFDDLYNDFYYRRHNQFWYVEAMKKLPALTRSTQMIVCGEDLGMVPECVPWVMKDLNILSLEIQSMPKLMGIEFGNPLYYPQMSVCTISSHDTSTLRGWWEEDKERTQRYYSDFLGFEGEAPEIITGELCRHIIKQHLMSPSALCILTLQDWLSIDENIRYPEAAAERINIPSNPRHYWQFRIHIPIEDLADNKEFNDNISALIQECGR